MTTFSQPASDSWDPDSGQPYPGSGDAAKRIAEADEKHQRDLRRQTEKEKALATKLGRQDAEEEENKLRVITARKGDSIVPRRVRWLWAPGDQGYGRIPIGELTLIVGRGGIGKSTLLAEFGSWITTGTMHGEFFGTPKDILYVANEDSLEYTVAPRLIAAGADMARVHFIGVDMAGRAEKVLLPSDCDGLGAYARAHGAAAIMLDPLSSNLRAKANAGDEIRPVIEIVRQMAEGADVAAIGLGHTRKQVSTNLMDAIMGSSELGNVCRAAMGAMVDPDEEGTVILSQEKNNLGRMRELDSYRYKVDTALIYGGTELVETSKVEWLGRTPLKVSDMMADGIAQGVVSKHGVAECMDFISDYLSGPTMGGQALRGEILKAASGEGYSRPTVDRAAARLKLVSRPSGNGAKRLWCLPGA